MHRLKLLALMVGALAICAVAAPAAGAAVGGPVILGGDDLTDHGGMDSETNQPEEGWIYIDSAIANLKPKVGRANDGSIAAIGSYEQDAEDTFGAGRAIKLAGDRNGMSVRFFGGPAETQQAFAEIASGAYRPAIVWISGSEAENDLSDHLVEGEQVEGHFDEPCIDDDVEHLTEGEVVKTNAPVINTFVNEGGGLMSHGVCYDWLSALLPGLSTEEVGSGIGSLDPQLTPAGISAFPGVTNEMISGQWHNHFLGDLGGLQILAEAFGDEVQEAHDTPGDPHPHYSVVIGGGQVSLTEKPADLAITKVDSSDPITAGSDLTYTLTVTNNGPNPATGVTVTDTLPSGLSAKSSTASQGSCSGTTTVTCSLGDLASGASATVSIVVTTSTAGTITNSASVSGNQPDPNSANNSATQQTTVAAAPAAQRPPRADRRAPVISVAGVRAASCTSSSFTAQVRVRDASRLRSVRVFINGRRVQSTTRKRFGVRVSVGALRAGRVNTLRVVAVDARGNRRAVSRTFRRCALPPVAPVFTG
jgi:uncharacterized repeat protein (TIGR01451 family)